jgi:hypothetical protein
MAGRAFHETGLAYMKFGAVGGEMFGDHETNEFVDKLYLKKSREWEADDEQTRQRRAAEEKIKGSWNPVNWLGDALNTINPSVDDIQRGHADAQAAWGKERRDNAYDRLEHEYGPQEAKRIMADLENQGLDPKDIEKAAKQKVNDTRDAEDTEKTWRKIEKQHGKAVADALRGSGADLTDMGLIHAADDIADRKRREQEAADAAEREAQNRENAEAKVRKILGPHADEFLDQHTGEPVNWIIEKAQQQSEKEQRERDMRAYYEKQEKKQQEERERKEAERLRKEKEKLEREEEDRIKAERRKEKEDAEIAAQNAEGPAKPQKPQSHHIPQSRSDSQPEPRPQPPAYVPPQPESRPAKQPEPAPQKPDQKPAQTRSSPDAKQGGGSFERIQHHDDAQEERPAKQEAQPQKPPQQPAERAPQPRPQRAPEPAPLPPPQPPAIESKPQQSPVQPPEKKAEEPPPPPVTVPVYQYSPPPRKEVEPQKPPEPKVPEQKMQEQPPEPEPQKPEPPPEVAPQQSSAQPDAPSSEEPEVLPGIHQSYTAEENTREPISGNDLADLYDRVRSIGEDVTETPEAQHEIARSKLQEIEDALNSGNFETDDDKNNAAIIKKAIDKTKELFDKK